MTLDDALMTLASNFRENEDAIGISAEDMGHLGQIYFRTGMRSCISIRVSEPPIIYIDVIFLVILLEVLDHHRDESWLSTWSSAACSFWSPDAVDRLRGQSGSDSMLGRLFSEEHWVGCIETCLVDIQSRLYRVRIKPIIRALVAHEISHILPKRGSGSVAVDLAYLPSGLNISYDLAQIPDFAMLEGELIADSRAIQVLIDADGELPDGMHAAIVDSIFLVEILSFCRLLAGGASLRECSNALIATRIRIKFLTQSFILEPKRDRPWCVELARRNSEAFYNSFSILKTAMESSDDPVSFLNRALDAMPENSSLADHFQMRCMHLQIPAMLARMML